jgi:hypothetical protein
MYLRATARAAAHGSGRRDHPASTFWHAVCFSFPVRGLPRLASRLPFPDNARVRRPFTPPEEADVEEFLRSYGWLSISLGILLTGIPGVPMPEELPVVLGGVLAGHGLSYWWVMLPVCIVSVIIGDSFLYLIGRFYGPRLLTYRWVQRRLLTPA